MNAPNTNLPAKVQVKAGGQVAALIPQSLDEAFRVSNAIAASGLAPRGIDKPEQIMVAIMAGAELGLAPFQSLQSFAVVNGRPTLWGDGLIAVVRGQGVKVREWLEGTDDNMVAHCEATRPDNGEVIARSFSVADARKAGLWGKQGPWQQYPKRMLQMRARALSLRDGCADMLRGIQVREEVEDYQQIKEVTPKSTGMRARLEARPVEGGFDADFIASELDKAGEQPGETLTAEFTDIAPDPEPDPPTPDDFPGDRPAETEAGATDGPPADPDVINVDLEDASADQVAAWVEAFKARSLKLATVEDLAAAWSEQFKAGRLTHVYNTSQGVYDALEKWFDQRKTALVNKAGAQ